VDKELVNEQVALMKEQVAQMRRDLDEAAHLLSNSLILLPNHMRYRLSRRYNSLLKEVRAEIEKLSQR
jgi:hypothetical protein